MAIDQCSVMDMEKDKFVELPKNSGKPAIKGSTELKDYLTNAPFAIAPSGALETGQLIRLTGGNFESGPILAHKYEQVVSGSGTISAAEGELILTTGITANSDAMIQSANRAIFNAATFNKAHHAVQTPNFDNVDVIRRWGMFDPALNIISGDGMYWENDSGVYTINRVKSGVIVETIDEVDFNGINPLVKNSTLNLYEIIYNAGTALFMQNRCLIHKMNVVDSAGYETVHLPVGMELININGNIVDNSMRTRGFACSRIGTDSSVPDKFFIDGGSPDTGIIESSPSIFDKVIIGDVGVGGASVTFYDWNVTSPPASSKIITISMTEGIQPLDMGFTLNMGLVYEKSGSGFEILAVTK